MANPTSRPSRGKGKLPIHPMNDEANDDLSDNASIEQCMQSPRPSAVHRAPNDVMRPTTFREWAEIGFKARVSIFQVDAEDNDDAPAHLKAFILDLAKHIRTASQTQQIPGDSSVAAVRSGQALKNEHRAASGSKRRNKGIKHAVDRSYSPGQDSDGGDDHALVIADDSEESDEQGELTAPSEPCYATAGSLPPRVPASAGRRRSESPEEHRLRDTKAPPRLPTKVLQHRWGAIMNRTTFQIPQAILQHMNRFGDDGLAFLCDPEALGTDLRAVAEHDSGVWQLALAVRWDHMDDLDDRRKGLDTARRLSHMLFVRDLVRLIDPRASTRQPRPQTWAALRQVLAQISSNRESIDHADAAKKLWKRFKYGEKIHHLNKALGAGAAFVLARQLSNDFLKEKSPPTVFRARAYEHLRNNQSFLKAEAIARRLGENVREFLIRPLRQGYQLAGISGSNLALDTDMDDEEYEDNEYDEKEAQRITKQAMRELLLGASSSTQGSCSSSIVQDEEADADAEDQVEEEVQVESSIEQEPEHTPASPRSRTSGRVLDSASKIGAKSSPLGKRKQDDVFQAPCGSATLDYPPVQAQDCSITTPSAPKKRKWYKMWASN